MPDRDLARYQSTLLTLLARTDIDGARRLEILNAAPSSLPYAEYVRSFDRDLVDLGAGIIERWGRPKVRRDKRDEATGRTNGTSGANGRRRR